MKLSDETERTKNKLPYTAGITLCPHNNNTSSYYIFKFMNYLLKNKLNLKIFTKENPVKNR